MDNINRTNNKTINQDSEDLNYKTKLLVVDDEENIRDLLASSLRFAGFDVAKAKDGKQAFHIIKEYNPDLIVLDIMMPEMDGMQLAKLLRDNGNDVPIIFLTAKDDTDDIIQGLKLGADDYVTKPFSLEELVERIKNIVRRTSYNTTEPLGKIVVGDIILDENTYEVFRNEKRVDVSPTGYKLLRYLMLNEGSVVTKSQILSYVWESDWERGAAIVESYISYLRKKLQVNPDSKEVIFTRRGIGYIMRADNS